MWTSKYLSSLGCKCLCSAFFSSPSPSSNSHSEHNKHYSCRCSKTLQWEEKKTTKEKYKKTNVCLPFLPSIYLKNKMYLTLAYRIKKRCSWSLRQVWGRSRRNSLRLSPESLLFGRRKNCIFLLLLTLQQFLNIWRHDIRLPEVARRK